MSCGDQDYTIYPMNPPFGSIPMGTVNFATSSNSTFTTTTSISNSSIKFPSDPNPKDPRIEKLKSIKNKKDNTYILIMGRRHKDHDPNSDWSGVELDWETIIFDTFDACNVTEQILKKDNAKDLSDIRKYFYKNKKFFEITEINGN